MHFLFLIIAFTLNASANILLKLAAGKPFVVSFNPLELVWENRLFITSLGLFGLNIIFYYLALRNIPISVAYPIMVGMTFLITIGASVVLGESISYLHAIGLALIISGLFIVVYAMR